MHLGCCVIVTEALDCDAHHSHEASTVAHICKWQYSSGGMRVRNQRIFPQEGTAIPARDPVSNKVEGGPTATVNIPPPHVHCGLSTLLPTHNNKIYTLHTHQKEEIKYTLDTGCGSGLKEEQR